MQPQPQPMQTKEVPFARCALCQHEWQPRKKGKPKRCANKWCGSPNWATGYTYEKARLNALARERGGAR